MKKAVYGLKDAPRAWRKKLHGLLASFGLSSLYADPQLYAAHQSGKCQMILSAHVDDLKGGARKCDALRLLAHLEKHVGKCKQEWENFTHVGIEHEKTPKGIWTHQKEYLKCLKEAPVSLYSGLAAEAAINEDGKTAFASLLGGIA